jgi:glycosyltransferase involved in cell wall biosynthesis
MNGKKVTVLLSTYNGQDYVKEQLDSIFRQTYKNIEIFVRDDGSTDETPEILKEYEKQGRIKAVYGENLGFTKSFCWLMENVAQADYYSFADQDDVWLEEKIEKAVGALEMAEQSVMNAALYFCDFDFYDSEMNFISHKKKHRTKLTLPNALVNNVGCGFTFVVNNELRRLFLLMPPEKNFSHDYLSILIGCTLGTVIYDKGVYAKYRRHGKNVSSYSSNFIKNQLLRLKFIFLSNNNQYKKNWKDFYETYANFLDNDMRNELKLFSNERYRLDYAVKKAFYPKRYRETLVDELAIRIFFIIGRI